MLAEAIKAKIPIIVVKTDDVVNVVPTLQSIAQKSVFPYSGLQKAEFVEKVLYYTVEGNLPSVGIYKALMSAGTSLVMVNPEKTNSLMFDVGEMPTPPKFIEDYLKDFVTPDELPKVMKALSGLSLKSASEIMQVTMAATHCATADAVRKTRSRLRGSIDGLVQESTELPFYVMPKKLRQWSEENKEYFLEDGWPAEMRPRGILMDGPPGTGKTLGAKGICKAWGIPLFRLKISGLLNKYIGVSETRLDSFLTALDNEAPCGLLIDEAEKLFRGDSEGTTNRQLAILLWWLQEHSTKVVTFATTNKFSAIPPEFYRPGRFDEIIRMRHMTPAEGRSFALAVYKYLTKKPADDKHEEIIDASLSGQDDLTQAWVFEQVVSLAKKGKWVEKS
jgi:hypothetical protein